VVAYDELADPDDQIEVADSDLIANLAHAGVYDAKAQPNLFSDLVAEQPAIERALEKARHQGDEREYGQTRFAAST
jgi:hypothetical protein